ncbi:MAG: TRAP transporter substrate-binding protein DctP [Gammaproteobacteria bacterium]|nr:TRAP transporter substrate-binding protein DctP [Gammaproteobacteria bacterium]
MNKITVIVCTLLAAGFANAQVLKIATVTPEGSQWMQEMRASADEIKTRTDGRVQIKYYGGGSQGNDTMVLRRISIGALQGGAFTPSALADKYIDLSLYGMPLVFDSEQEVEYVRTRMDERLVEGFAERGFVSFGFAATGFAVIMSNEPVRSLDDMRGKRVWVPEGDDLSKAAMEALSLSPVTLPLTDVYTGLQTGLIDIVAMSPIGALILQLHTKLKYITDVPLVYTMGFMAIEKKAFNKLKPNDQAIVRQVMTDLYAKYDKINMIDDREAKVALLNAGLKLIVPEEGELDRIRVALRRANDELARKGAVSPTLYQEMQAHVEAFRSQNPQEQVSAAGD